MPAETRGAQANGKRGWACPRRRPRPQGEPPARQGRSHRRSRPLPPPAGARPRGAGAPGSWERVRVRPAPRLPDNAAASSPRRAPAGRVAKGGSQSSSHHGPGGGRIPPGDQLRAVQGGKSLWGARWAESSRNGAGAGGGKGAGRGARRRERQRPRLLGAKGRRPDASARARAPARGAGPAGLSLLAPPGLWASASPGGTWARCHQSSRQGGGRGVGCRTGPLPCEFCLKLA